MRIKKSIKLVIAGVIFATGVTAFSSEASAVRPFTDIGNSGSHAVAIQYLNERDAFDYKTGTRFNGIAPVTRVEASVILHALYKDTFKPIRKYNNHFKDVNSRTKNYKEMIWSYEVGLFDGDGVRFLPSNHLTRAQMSKVLVNAFDLKTDKVITFSDVSPRHWYYDYVTALASNGVTVGNGKGQYMPNSPVTLNHLSTFIYRIIQSGLGEDLPQSTTPDEVMLTITEIEQAVLELTNQERQKAGIAPLQVDQALMNSARQKSKDMAVNKYFDHYSPTYGSFTEQMKGNGVTYRAAAENIAMGYRTAEQVVEGWMNSPGHRKNLMNATYTHIGIGYEASGHYWTQQFILK